MNKNLQWLDDLFADPSKIIMVMDLPQSWGIKTETLQAHKDEIFPDREGRCITVSEGKLGTPHIEATYSNTPLARASLNAIDGLNDNQKKQLSELPNSYLDAQEEIYYRIERPAEQLALYQANVETLLTTVGVENVHVGIYEGQLRIEKTDLDTLRSIKDAGLEATTKAVREIKATQNETAQPDPLDEDFLMGDLGVNDEEPLVKAGALPTAQITEPQESATIITFPGKDSTPPR